MFRLYSYCVISIPLKDKTWEALDSQLIDGVKVVKNTLKVSIFHYWIMKSDFFDQLEELNLSLELSKNFWTNNGLF